MANDNLVPAAENAQVARTLLTWLNTYPAKPMPIAYEFLGDTDGIMLSVIQSAYKTRKYIDGSYQAQIQFKVVRRVVASTNAERIQADEELDALGEWAETAERPTIGDNIAVESIQRNTASSLYARYDGGVSDHQILFTMIYEVMK